jgi:hypothetical protein
MLVELPLSAGTTIYKNFKNNRSIMAMPWGLKLAWQACAAQQLAASCSCCLHW